MTRRSKFRLTFSGAVVIAAFASGWLISGESSPLRDYFLFHVTIPNLWGTLNLLPYLSAFIFSDNPHSFGPMGYVVAVSVFIAQWFMIGYVASAPFAKLIPTSQKPLAVERVRVLARLGGNTRVVLERTEVAGAADGGVVWEVPTGVIPAHLRGIGSRFLMRCVSSDPREAEVVEGGAER
jgi:hypothetical protein